MKLNIGCGLQKLDGYINLDIDPSNCPDVERDIEKGLPFDDNKFDYIYCSHVLEHIKDLIFVMDEIYRTLKPNGIIHIKVPPYDFEGAFSDPTHVRFFTPRSFKYFTKERFDWVWGYPKDIKCIFEIVHFVRSKNKNDPTCIEYQITMRAEK